MVKHTEYTALVAKDGDFYVGLVLEVPGAIAYAKNEEDLNVDLSNAISAVHMGLKLDQEAVVRNNPRFANATTQHVQLCF